MTQPERTPTPSPEAMRAAQNLLPGMRPRDDAKIIATAEIIDSEFRSLRENREMLVRACKAAQAAMWDAHYGRCIAVEYVQGVDKEVRAALQSAKGEGEA